MRRVRRRVRRVLRPRKSRTTASRFRPEVKFTTVANNAGSAGDYVALTNAGATTTQVYIQTYPLFTCIQGSDQNNRIGRKVWLQGISLRYYLSQQANNVAGLKAKWYLFHYKDYVLGNYGVTPTIIGAFLDLDCQGKISTVSFRNEDLKQGYRVLKTGWMTMPKDCYGTQNLVVSGKIAYKFKKPLLVSFNGAGASTITSGAIFLCVVANQGDVAALTGCNFVFQGRCYFTDF